jgi:hypothetical protein
MLFNFSELQYQLEDLEDLEENKEDVLDELLYTRYEQLQNIIPNLLNLTRLARNKKKIKSITSTIHNCMCETRLKFCILQKVINYLYEISIFTFTGGNIFNILQEHLLQSTDPKINENINYIIEFFKLISEQTPSGLSTSPNAGCGKFELLYHILYKSSKIPKKGDIVHDGKKIEIKGCQVKIQSDSVNGTTYYKKMMKLSTEFSYPPHECKCKKYEESFEPEKLRKKEYFKPLFEQDVNKSKQFHKKWFGAMSIKLTEEENNRIHQNNKWNLSEVRKLIFYKFAEQKWSYDTLWLCGNGTNIKIINSLTDLKNKLQTNEIEINNDDYFRIAQNYTIGLYLKN